MSAPQIIAGPAIVQHNGQVYYTEGDVTVADSSESFLVRTALHGTIDERFVAGTVAVSFKPAGCLDVVAKYLPYALNQIGTLLIDQANPESLIVWARDGRKTTWGAAFMSRLPSFNLSAVATALNDMEFICLANPTKDLTAADAWNTFANAALSDTSFDETDIITPRYTATWGTFEGMESETGFLIEPVMGFSLKKIANWGNVNALLTDVTIGCRFVPASLDEDDIWSLRGKQGSDAILPGDSFTKADDDLVITGGAASFTLHKAGPKSAVTRYGLEPLRQGEVAFVTRKTATAGALNALFTFAFS